ncbi:unnamed protein product [Echinostoma caproni]|uniref:Protein ARV n=1 Tax=Echinostoma caproni TaxID=27848 RepID=A0A183B2H7_9TREM|nr:unnamed protein product [Echinostoma caproni]
MWREFSNCTENVMESFRCIFCGCRVPVIYTQYTDEVIRMERCPKCTNVVDKYAEYDVFIVAIDLIALRIEAYRHIIYNSREISWTRILLLSLLLNSFVSWLSEQGITGVDLANLSLTFKSDLYIHVLSNIFWCFIYSLSMFCMFFILCFSVPIQRFLRLLAIVNMSKLLTFFVLPWASSWNSGLTMEELHFVPFYPVVFSSLALLAGMQSTRALTECSLIVAFLLNFLSSAFGFIFFINSSSLFAKIS